LLISLFDKRVENYFEKFTVVVAVVVVVVEEEDPNKAKRKVKGKDLNEWLEGD
jgi:hypothetical protein